MAKRKFKLQLRNLSINDYDNLVEVMKTSYSNIGGIWRKEQIEKLIEIFPEGQLAIEDKGKLVAFALTIIVDYKKYGDDHDYISITGNYTFNTHD